MRKKSASASPRRAMVIGGVATLLATVVFVETGSPAGADQSLVPGVDLPVPVSDVTSSDSELGSAAREVVVVLDSEGTPEVRKLRARTQSEARVLVSELNGEPGVVASVNRPVKVPEAPSESSDTDKAQTAFDVAPRAAVKSVVRLAAEPLAFNQWGLTAVNAEGAWSFTRGAGAVVAIIDTGVDGTHPDLAGQVLPQVDLVGDGLSGDPVGHGTHVAGIVAAALDGAGTAGLADQVRLLPIRVLGPNGGDEYTVANGVYTAVEAGAEVINLSLGWEGYDPPAVHAAVQYALDRGVTVVAAVGNEYEEGNPVEYPVAQAGVIGVTSIDPEYGPSGFANTGYYVDLTAPGEDILSTIPGGWDYEDGTSMAAPFVSATAALVRVANPTLTAGQVERVLFNTALDDGDFPGRDDLFGHGLLQADQATRAAATAPWGISRPKATVKLRAVSKKSKLRVDVNPNKGRGYWKFKVQKQRADGSWKALKTYKTKGKKETRTINLKRGTYRVLVKPKYGYGATASGQVSLRR